ncbi:ester cyclase [Amycolatopsis anabasis]|uniref:ester cyclase n=1 Tax=Amycolatopsis anabasis TaxID=1840409 RepID=UPI00131E9DF4|nr:ester cyclase [Amycolatopsis anabasis]
MSERDKAVVRRFIEEFVNAHDLTGLGEVVAEDVTESGPVVVDAPSGGLDAFRRGWQMMLDSFPDIHVTVDDLVAEPGKVAARISLSATNTGYYRRGAATGKHAEWRGFVLARLRDGKIAHVDAMTDRFGMLRQLGIIGDDDELAAPRRAG